MGTARRAAAGEGAAGALGNHDLPRRPATRSHRGAMAAHRADQWRKVPALCREGPRPNLETDDIVIMDNLGSHKGRAVSPREASMPSPLGSVSSSTASHR